VRHGPDNGQHAGGGAGGGEPGQLRWQGRSRAGRLHLESRQLARGLYGAVISKDGSVSRRNLSLE